MIDNNPVKVGVVSGQLAEILEGLTPGEKVITAGLEDVHPGQLVAPSRTGQ